MYIVTTMWIQLFLALHINDGFSSKSGYILNEGYACI